MTASSPPAGTEPRHRTRAHAGPSQRDSDQSTTPATTGPHRRIRTSQHDTTHSSTSHAQAHSRHSRTPPAETAAPAARRPQRPHTGNHTGQSQQQRGQRHPPPATAAVPGEHERGCPSRYSQHPQSQQSHRCGTHQTTRQTRARTTKRTRNGPGHARVLSCAGRHGVGEPAGGREECGDRWDCGGSRRGKEGGVRRRPPPGPRRRGMRRPPPLPVPGGVRASTSWPCRTAPSRRARAPGGRWWRR